MLKRHKLANAGAWSMVSQSGVDPTEMDIAVRAYFYWERRGGQGGSPEQDWYRAVDDLKNERTGRVRSSTYSMVNV